MPKHPDKLSSHNLPKPTKTGKKKPAKGKRK